MFDMRQNNLRTICSSCYLACASGGPHNHHKWNTDMYLMMTTEIISLRNRGFAIIALGDFNSKVGQIPGLEGNTPNHNANTPLFNIFISSLHLTILNTLPISQGLFIHFVEKDGVPYSESVLDYGLADASITPHITSFVIDADSRISCGTDHALLIATINSCQRKKKVSVDASYSDILNFKNLFPIL